MADQSRQSGDSSNGDTDQVIFDNSQATPPPAPPICKASPKEKRGKRTHISEADLRRSDRIHNQSRGFKSSLCKDKNCLGCSPNPPVLSMSVVRDLGTAFCNIEPEKLSDEVLTAKNSKAAVQKPTSKKLRITKEADKGPSKKPAAKAKKGKKSASEKADQDSEAEPSSLSRN